MRTGDNIKVSGKKYPKDEDRKKTNVKIKCKLAPNNQMSEFRPKLVMEYHEFLLLWCIVDIIPNILEQQEIVDIILTTTGKIEQQKYCYNKNINNNRKSKNSGGKINK